MAAPTHTTRVTPSGSRLDNGYQSLITFASKPNIKLWEKTVQPPGLDGGDAIPTTTMHNIALRTFAPAALITMTEITFKAAYDPAVYDDLRALINVRDTITVQFPGGGKLSLFAFLRVAEFDELQENVQPEGTFTITPTNTDSAGTERVPVYGT